MANNVAARATSLIVTNEGFYPYMYLDTVDKVTIGYGHLLHSSKAAATLDLRDVKGKAATLVEKTAEWTRVDKLSNNVKANKRASSFGKDATLFITESEGARLLETKLAGFTRMLKVYYRGYDKFPDDAKVALLDMTYNLGSRIKSVFRKFSASINASGGPDWEAAAAQSRRPQLSLSRNLEIRKLFLKAAQEAKKTKAVVKVSSKG